MYERWDVLPDGEREQWVLEPFEGVGPLRFGMLIDEVSNTLSRRTGDLQRYSGPCLAEDPYGLVTGRYRDFGLTLYYWDERLRGVSADALCGPQVSVEGVALTGRRPSELGRWLWDRADALAPVEELVLMGGGEFCSESLGLVIGVQRAGDGLLSRPVFFSAEGLPCLHDFLPDEAFRITG
ncbi:hypothetical protein ACWD4P_38230 [Kitasatospora sp. NPDC002543]